jgi:hypothetical protein
MAEAAPAPHAVNYGSELCFVLQTLEFLLINFNYTNLDLIENGEKICRHYVRNDEIINQ